MTTVPTVMTLVAVRRKCLNSGLILSASSSRILLTKPVIKSCNRAPKMGLRMCISFFVVCCQATLTRPDCSHRFTPCLKLIPRRRKFFSTSASTMSLIDEFKDSTSWHISEIETLSQVLMYESRSGGAPGRSVRRSCDVLRRGFRGALFKGIEGKELEFMMVITPVVSSSSRSLLG